MKILGFNYTVNWDLCDSNLIGRTDNNNLTISFRKDTYPEGRMMEVMAHEIFHAINDDLNLELDENTIQRLAVSWLSVLLDNGVDFSPLMLELNEGAK